MGVRLPIVTTQFDPTHYEKVNGLIRGTWSDPALARRLDPNVNDRKINPNLADGTAAPSNQPAPLITRAIALVGAMFGYEEGTDIDPRWEEDQHKERVVVGTIFAADEAHVIQAIDEYAARHFSGNRSAVVREALARLLAIDVARQ